MSHEHQIGQIAMYNPNPQDPNQALYVSLVFVGVALVGIPLGLALWRYRPRFTGIHLFPRRHPSG